MPGAWFSFDSVLGGLAGGAIGDSVGGVLERGALSLSDDTQLTLATCEAILEAGRADPETIARSLLRWYRSRRLSGLGSATLKALRDLEAGAHWALSGARGERAAGNGAAMRAAPLAVVLDPESPANRVVIRDVCRITHHHDEAYLGALAVLVAIRSGPKPSDLLFAEIASVLPDCRVRDRLLELAALPEPTELASVASRYGASGFVVDTVPLALLLACQLVSDFEVTLRRAAELPGDMDTICSIAGQVAGAHLGYSRLPTELRDLPPVVEATTMFRPFAEAIGRGGLAGSSERLGI